MLGSFFALTTVGDPVQHKVRQMARDLQDLIDSARDPLPLPKTHLQRIDQVYDELARTLADVASVPGTETALIATSLVAALRALADARALVILNGY
jgi:hypothetical protein